MKVFSGLAFAFAVFLLSSCAAPGPAGYQAADQSGFGYTETKIEDDRYRIVYRGGGGVPPEVVEGYALKRAAELALANGFDWFRVVGGGVQGEKRGGVGLGLGFGTGSYGRRSGVSVGAGGDLGTVGGQVYYTASLEVLMGSGETPDEPDYYNARAISESITSLAD